MSMRELCPFIKSPPSSKCYCVEVNSQKIPNLLEYCAKNFLKCNFYITNIKNVSEISQCGSSKSFS